MEVLARWGLGDAEIEPVESGATNQTWRISNGDRTCFLRRSRTTNHGEVQREHDLIEHVVDAGVCAPRPIADVDGATVIRHDGAVYSLFASAEGRQREPGELSVGHAVSAGAVLGALHAATARVDRSRFRTVTLWWDGPAWAQRIRATAQMIPRDSPRAVDEWAHERSLAQAAWLDHPDCRHEYVPTADGQVVHGDYQHTNLFFTGSEISGVIDWDTCVAATRGFEVVRACSFMFGLDELLVNSFVSGYRSAAPLSADELDDGARAWGCYADHHVWPMEETYRHGNRAAERFIPHRPFQPFEASWDAVVLDAV